MGAPPRSFRAPLRRRHPRRTALVSIALIVAVPLFGTACGSHKKATAAAPALRPTLAAPTPGGAAAGAPAATTSSETLPPLSRKPVPTEAARQASRADETITSTPRPTASTGPVAVPTCPLTSHAKPSDERPLVSLTFDLAND